MSTPLCLSPDLVTSPGNGVVRVYGAGSAGANGLYKLSDANDTLITYRKQASTAQDGIDLLYSPPGRFALYLDVSSHGPGRQSWRIVDTLERTTGSDDSRTDHGGTLYTGTPGSNGTFEGIEWSIGDQDIGTYPPPVVGCAPRGDWSPLNFNFDRDDILPNGDDSGTEWRDTLYMMEV